MQLSRLFTYSFDPNVGPIDRVFRILSGAGMAILPWAGYVDMPGWATILLTVFGIAWFFTGIVSRCGMYYLFGLTTKKV